MVAAPVVWVGLEFVRAYVAHGLPLVLPGAQPARVLPVIQMADLAGALGSAS